MTPDAYRALAFPGAQELGNMFQFKRDFNREFRGRRDVDYSRALNPGLQIFAEWLAADKGRIPLN